MSQVKTFQKSCGAGEVSPEMWGRIDDAKWDSGLAVCRNFITTPQGPALNRPGFQYVTTARTASGTVRLIPFTYSTVNTMVIEVGAGYFRFTRNGQVVKFATPSAYAAATFYPVGSLIKYDSGYWYCILAATSPAAYSAATAYTVGQLSVYGGLAWQCTVANTGQTPFIGSSYWVKADAVWPTYFASLPHDMTYQVPNSYADADIMDIHYVQSNDVLTLVHPNYPPMTLNHYGDTNWTFTAIPFAPSLSSPSGLSGTFSLNGGTDTSGLSNTYKYVVTALANDTITESKQSTTASVTGNLLATGASVNLSWTANSPAPFAYNIYKMIGGVFGYIGQTAGTTFVDNNIAPDLGKTPPYYDTDYNVTNNAGDSTTALFAGANNYPAAVGYYQQRKVLAGTVNKPQNVWMTKSGTEALMSYSLPVRDNDEVVFRVAALQSQTVRHIVPLTQLILLTSSMEWKVSGAGSDTVTPSSVSVSPQSYIGSSNVQPCVIQNSLLFAAARGGHVREMLYNWQAGGFVSNDLSLRAAHLFDNLTIRDMAYSKSPRPIVWCVSSGGGLLGLTYLPEQQISAWHRHDTGTTDTFQSVCVVPEGNEDVLYAVVKRKINNVTVQTIERLASRLFASQRYAYFVDCGMQVDCYAQGITAGATRITGLDWLVNQSVAVVHDGAVLTNRTVGFNVYSATGNGSTTTYTHNLTYNLSKHLAVTVAGITQVLGVDYTISGTNITFTTAPASGYAINILVTYVTLDTPTLAASVVNVGLPIVADIQTLPMAAGVDNAMTQGRMKNVNKIWIRVKDSAGWMAGPDSSSLVKPQSRTTEAYGTPPGLHTEEVSLLISPQWSQSGQLWIRQSNPLPLEIIGMTMEVSLGS